VVPGPPQAHGAWARPSQTLSWGPEAAPLHAPQPQQPQQAAAVWRPAPDGVMGSGSCMIESRCSADFAPPHRSTGSLVPAAVPTTTRSSWSASLPTEPHNSGSIMATTMVQENTVSATPLQPVGASSWSSTSAFVPPWQLPSAKEPVPPVAAAVATVVSAAAEAVAGAATTTTAAPGRRTSRCGGHGPFAPPPPPPAQQEEEDPWASALAAAQPCHALKFGTAQHFPMDAADGVPPVLCAQDTDQQLRDGPKKSSPPIFTFASLDARPNASAAEDLPDVTDEKHSSSSQALAFEGAQQLAASPQQTFSSSSSAAAAGGAPQAPPTAAAASGQDRQQALASKAYDAVEHDGMGEVEGGYCTLRVGDLVDLRGEPFPGEAYNKVRGSYQWIHNRTTDQEGWAPFEYLVLTLP